MLTSGVYCHHHPQRLGIGICVECRQVICAECSTQFDGINRCSSCLAKLAPKAAEPSRFREWGPWSIAGALVCFASLYAAVVLVAVWVSP